MNHADRQRLSDILRTMSAENAHADPSIYTPDHKAMRELIDEARAIVDGTTMCGNCGTK